MVSDDVSWLSGWTVGLRLWVERAGHAVLGPGRLELLQGIDRWGSISAAARQMGMSYRRAWLLVEDINRAAGEPLVEAQAGGREGGGARLTGHGRMAVRAYRDLQAQVSQAAAGLLPRVAQEAGTAGVHVAAAASLEDVLCRLLADFAVEHPSVGVRTVCGASDELASHLLSGTHVDLFLSAEVGHLRRLQEAGVVAPGAGTWLAANGLAAVGPADVGPAGARPAPRSPRGLLGPAVRRIALADPACPLGGYTRRYLEALGLWEGVRARALFLDNPRGVLAAVQAGRAEVGLVYRSDAMAGAGCRTLFNARPDQAAVRYAAALTRRGEQCPAARSLLAFLTSPAAARHFRRAGFLPAGGAAGAGA
jgi:molybdenum ABC transporter molybdate-binding protein